MEQTQWSNKEIRMLYILGAIIGMVIGLVVAWLSDMPLGDNFPWELLVTTGSVVGVFVGTFNRVPVYSCLGALFFGALLGAFVGAISGLISGAVFWFILWKLIIINIPGISASTIELGILIGAITGAVVIDPRLWHRVCFPFIWYQSFQGRKNNNRLRR